MTADITKEHLEEISKRVHDADEVLKRFSKPSEFTKCINPLLKALGWVGHPRHIVESLPHFSEIIDITALRNAMVELNYKSQAVRVRLNELDPRLVPCLYVPDNPNEPVRVVTKREGDLFWCHNTKTEREEMLEWPDISGVAYVFSRMSEKSKAGESTNWFKGLFARFKGLIVQLLVISLFVNLFMLAVPLFIMVVYDRVIGAGSVTMLANFSLGVMLALAGMYILFHVRTKIIAYIGARLDHIVGKVILERLLNLAPVYTESAQLGAQVARIKDFDTVRDFFTGPLFALMFELPFVIFFMFVIWLLGGSLVLVPIVMLVMFALLFFIINPSIRRAVAKTAFTCSKRQTFQLETLSNIDTIKYCAAEETWALRHKEISAEATHAAFKATLLSMVVNAISDAMMTVAGLAVMAFGVLQVFNGAMSIGGLIAVMMLVWRILAPIKRTFASMTKLSQVLNSIRQINMLMNLRPEREPYKLIYPITRFNGDVEFKRVSFRYRSNLPPALFGVSFKIEPGELVAVVGRNGSGKSTLLKLMAEMYTPQAGGILIDSQDIRQQDAIELRHAVAYMPQSSVFFYGTIEQNLLFANPVATRHCMIAATRLAGCYDDIMAMDEGFQSRIREKGSERLSAGFLQKLALARTYIKNAGIMLFDEPGTSLDFEADKHFMKVLDALKHNTTVILVTHRPGHLTMADRILFLDQGQLIMNGKPEEVLPKIPKDYL